MNLHRPFATSFLALACTLLAWTQPAVAATSTTGAIDIPATADGNGSIGSFTVSTPVGSPFDVQRYSGPDILTGLSFAAQVENVSMNFSGTVNVFGLPVPVTGGASVEISASLGGTTVNGSPLLPFVRPGLNNSGAFATPTGQALASQLGSFYDPAGSTFGAAGTVNATTTVNKIAIGGGTLTGNPAPFTATIEYDYQTRPHANGSFDPAGANALSLDFGNVAGSKPISLYNGTGLFDLDITNISCAGAGCGFFSLANTFADIAGGASAPGTVSYLGGAAGPVSAVFSLTVGDSVNAALVGVGRQANLETLEIAVSAVPEPSAWMLAALGAAVLGVTARRRRPVH